MTKLKYQFETIQAIRNFFLKEGFMDVLTPPMVQNPGMETHIHPFEVFSKHKKSSTDLFLHTSPEFHMKSILATEEDLNDIFTISYCFRDEPRSDIHREQFLMLEWYRKFTRYEKIMDDVEFLILSVSKHLEEKKIPLKHKYSATDFQRATVQEIFKEFTNIDILNFLDTNELKKLIQKDFKGVPLPSVECSWDDYFFLLFLNEVEPHFKNYKSLLLYEFPEPLSALSTIKETDSRVCERFEVYLNGIELCNCFNELTDLNIQKQRFDIQKQEKKSLYNYDLPEPTDFYQTLKGGYPKSSGIALGVERLLYSLVEIKNPFFK